VGDNQRALWGVDQAEVDDVALRVREAVRNFGDVCGEAGFEAFELRPVSGQADAEEANAEFGVVVDAGPRRGSPSIITGACGWLAAIDRHIEAGLDAAA
jgi:hypothetical protein